MHVQTINITSVECNKYANIDNIDMSKTAKSTFKALEIREIFFQSKPSAEAGLCE